MKTSLFAIPLVATFAFSGCGSEDDPAGAGASEHQTAAWANGACESSADCPAVHACLVVGNQGGCTPICNGSSNQCGAQASCGGVGATSIDVCQPVADPNDPPDAEEQPRLPCKSDAECGNLQSGLICAEYMGARDCTLPCSIESDCDIPAMGGISMDFMTCAADEGNSSRNACLPDARCFNNPMVCVTF